MRTLHYYILLFVVIAGFSSCSKVPDTINFIPSDASAVISINTNKIGKEIAWNVITGSKVFEKMNKNEKKGSEALKEFTNSGIELMDVAYVYFRTDSVTSQDRMYIVMPVKDEDKLEAYIKKYSEKAVITKQKGFLQATIGEDILGWNDEILVYTQAVRSSADMSALLNNSTDMNRDQIQQALNTYLQTTVDSTKTTAMLTAAFGVKKENSMANNQRFVKLQRENHYLSYWVNYDKIASREMTQSSVPGLAAASMLWKDNELTGSIDFEDGKIVGDMSYFTSDMLKQIFEKISGQEVDKAMLSKIESENLAAAVAIKIPFQSMKDLLTKVGMAGSVDEMLRETGFTLNDITTALSGDIVITVNDTKPATIGSSDSQFGELTIALKVNDKATLDKFIQFVQTQGVIETTGPDRYTLANSEGAIGIYADKSYLVVSTKKEKMDAFLARTQNNLPKPAAEALQGHTSGFYLSVDGMLALTRVATLGFGDPQLESQTAGTFEYLSAYTGKFETDHYTSHFELSFKNKKENSLMQLIDFAMKYSDAKVREMDESMNATNMPVPTGSPDDTALQVEAAAPQPAEATKHQ